MELSPMDRMILPGLFAPEALSDNVRSANDGTARTSRQTSGHSRSDGYMQHIIGRSRAITQINPATNVGNHEAYGRW